MVRFWSGGSYAEKAVAVQVPPQLQAAVARLEAATTNFESAASGPFSVPDNHGSLLHHVDKQPSVDVAASEATESCCELRGRTPRRLHAHRQQTSRRRERIVIAARQGIGPPNIPTGISCSSRSATKNFRTTPSATFSGMSPTKRNFVCRLRSAKGRLCLVHLHLGLEQHFVRKKLQLTGGDDPLQLALLTLPHQGQALGFLFTECGQRDSRRSISHAGRDDPYNVVRKCNAIRNMESFRDAQATARLIDLYFIHGTTRSSSCRDCVDRPSATTGGEQAYIDMISHFGRSSEAIEICKESG